MKAMSTQTVWVKRVDEAGRDCSLRLMDNQQCRPDATSIEARAVASGANRQVRVTGTLTCPAPGYQVTLEHTNPGINPDPDSVVLRLVEVPPPGIVPQVETSTLLDHIIDAPLQATRVAIRNVGVFPIVETDL